MICQVCQTDLTEIAKSFTNLEHCPKCGAGVETETDEVQLPAELLAEVEKVPEEHRGVLHKAIDFLTGIVKGRGRRRDDDDDNDPDHDEDTHCPECGKPYDQCECDERDEDKDDEKKSLYYEFEALMNSTIDGTVILKALTDEIVELRCAVQELAANQNIELSKALSATAPEWATALSKSITDAQASMKDVLGFVERVRQHPAAAQLGAAAAGDAVAAHALALTNAQAAVTDAMPKNYPGLIKALGAAIEKGEPGIDRRAIDSGWLRSRKAEEIARLEAIAEKFGYVKES